MIDRIEKHIELKAPIERVWRALTDHREFSEWFKAKIDSPFQPGETIRGQNACPGYEHASFEVKVLKMEAPRFFSYTWHPYAIDPKMDYSQETPTLVEFWLEPIPAGTRLRVVESGFEKLPPHRRSEALRTHEPGWIQQLENIKTHVER
ncbi:Activator of Hsp90 ATPase 1 family protein [Methylocella silvestris BL2]|uniref:Activator of Hsp90 ATPase 1 family protein n=1 Tax=Methylocella silvestris (strain DSM 15510 / CIP 108128 / LMG 27833 / NCIMB 13906 / BL2) TaxID=395965 RepID=B8ENF7_METSB|nr:SRPBCC family protein [Methylocella silvestris]ACK50088.1 Activator of Hsp90 ATPase 1 family protein [Methylocella silvestris BL2]